MSASSTSIKELFDNSTLEHRINMYYRSKISSAKDPDRNTSKDLETCSRSSYMQIKDINGISLHRHVCALLEKLIFQRPPNPVKFFEYYSEEIKKEYRNPIRIYGTHFLDSIDLNACKNSTELYKNILWSWNKENRKHSQGNDLNDYEDENDYEEGDDWMYGESEEGRLPSAEVQELSVSNKAFNKAGCGLTVEEAEAIGATMDQMSRSGKLKNIRYWGIMFGLRRNYYVLECEWLDDEIERRVKKSMEVQGVREPVDIEYDEMAYGEAVDELDRFTIMAPSEHDQDEERNYYGEMTEDYYKDHFEFAPGDEMLTQCQKQLKNETSDLLQPEMLGFGTNRKTYFVTHQPSAEWIELPLLKPHHVVQSRKIKRYLVGDLDSPMDCYPTFDGLEKHYLRAQIARITAATQISPVGYFNPVDEIRKSSKSSFAKSNPLYHKSVVQKSVYEYSTNEAYKSLPIYDLMDPDNWVHHTPMITDDGVTEVWLDILSTIKQNKNFDGEEFYDDDEDQSQSDQTDEESSTRVGRDVFVSISEDDFVGESQPWNVEITNKFDHGAAYLAVKSNVWPGAVAVAGSNVMDFTYRGWGQKWDVKSLTPFMHTEYQNDYPGKNMLEAKDPTRAEELAVLEAGKQRAEEFKITLFPTSGLEEDDEKVVQKYSYD